MKHSCTLKQVDLRVFNIWDISNANYLASNQATQLPRVNVLAVGESLRLKGRLSFKVISYAYLLAEKD